MRRWRYEEWEQKRKDVSKRQRASKKEARGAEVKKEREEKRNATRRELRNSPVIDLFLTISSTDPSVAYLRC